MATAQTLSQLISPNVAKYFQAKMDYDPRVLTDTATETASQRALRQMNTLLQAKGGQQIVDLSQADTAFSPLIAKRNKRGLGGSLGTILPIALSLAAPGIGTALGAGMLGTAAIGAGLGAIGGGITGGNIKSALTGAAMGGASAGLGSAMSGAGGAVRATSGPLAGQMVNPGVFNSAIQGPAVANSILGNSAGSAVGGIQGALMNNPVARGLESIGKGVSNFGSSVESLANKATGGIFNGGFTGAGTSAASAAPSGGISSMNTLSNLLSGYQQYQTAGKQEKQLRQAQQQALAAYSPYASTGYQANTMLADALAQGFDPSQLENDPGYKFRLNQGQRQLEQGLAARGLGQSGAALKAAHEYGQNFANQEYTDAYNRWLKNNQQLAQQAGQGANIAGAQAGIYDTMGDVAANATGARSNVVNSTLSGILRGRGIVGFDAQGNPIYG